MHGGCLCTRCMLYDGQEVTYTPHMLKLGCVNNISLSRNNISLSRNNISLSRNNLPYTTHFQIYNVCFVGSSRCVRGFTIRNTLSNICCVGGKKCCVGGLPYTAHFQNMLCVITFYNRNVGCAYV